MGDHLVFSAGLIAGALIGVGATLIAYARPRQAPAVTPEPVAMAASMLPEPWPGYEASKVDDIKWMLRPLLLADREAVRKYEAQREAGPRKGIINVLNALEEELSVGTQGVPGNGNT